MRTDAYLTISIDDGHPLDLRVAELLEQGGLKATFYVSASDEVRPVMSKQQVRELCGRFEIGSHTYHHVPLKSLRDEQVRTEIVDGKRWLEDTTGLPARSFCYPRGKFTARTVELVKEAGFLGARTCYFNRNEMPRDPYRAGVSTHAYSHSALIQIRHALLEANFRGLADFFLIHKGARDWEAHFHHALDTVELHGGVAHLYFHSWEIEQEGQWDKLARILEHVSHRKQLMPVTNGELFALCHS